MNPVLTRCTIRSPPVVASCVSVAPHLFACSSSVGILPRFSHGFKAYESNIASTSAWEASPVQPNGARLGLDSAFREALRGAMSRRMARPAH